MPIYLFIKKAIEKRSYYSDTPGKFALLKELKRNFLQIFVVDSSCFCNFVGVTSYFTIILYLSAIPFSLFFPLTFSRRLDFSMQRYSSRPASSTAMLTARGFARQPSQIRDVLSVPRHVVPVGLGIP